MSNAAVPGFDGDSVFEGNCRLLGNFLRRTGITQSGMDSDETLMAGIGTGSQEAFAELFARYKDPVFAFFARRLARKDRAEDLTQETFLAVLSAAKRYEPRASVRSYLFAIAFRILMVERRKSKDAEAAVSENLSSPALDADESIWIRMALARLEDSEREILMLREYEQLSYAEIGEMLKLPVNTVRSRLFRSRMTLRTMLQEA